MFVIYQLKPEFSGDWTKVVTCDTWNGVVNFIESYYSGYKALDDDFAKSLPCPKNFEAAFEDVHGNVYVIYELECSYGSFPDIDEDYTDDMREYLRDKYYGGYDSYRRKSYDDYYDSDGYRIDDEYDSCYDDDGYSMNGPSAAVQREFLRVISRPGFIDYYLPYPIHVEYADRRNQWYVGALHGF